VDVFEIYGVLEKEISFSFKGDKITALKDSSIIEAGLRHYREGRIRAVKLEPEEAQSLYSLSEMRGNMGDPQGLRSFFTGDGSDSGYTEFSSGPVSDVRIHTDISQAAGSMSMADAMEDVESFLGIISSDKDDLLFSNKIKRIETLCFLANTNGAEMSCRDAWYEGEVLFKRRGSSDIYEGDIEFRVRCPHIAESRVPEYFDTVRSAFGKEMDVEAGSYKVAFACDDWTLMAKAIKDLYSKNYMSGNSFFAGRQSEKVMSENVSIVFSRDKDSFLPSFDPCGSSVDKARLVESGVFIMPYADRETAHSSGMVDTASAFSTPFGVPSPGYMGLRIEDSRDFSSHSSEPEVNEAMKGRVIVAHTLGGGDYSPSGHLATPIQFALVYDDGRLSGFAKSLAFSGEFSRMLGDGYVATVEPDSFRTPFSDKRVVIVEGAIGR
jgi:PmbA protein